MNWIDFLVSGCVLVPGISGFRAGLVAGLLKMAGILAGLALAVWKMPLLTQLAATTLDWKGPGAPLGALATGVFAGWILGMLAGWGWKKFSEGTQIGWADRFAGFAMGAAKGSLFALVLLAGATIAAPGLRQDIQASWVGRHALDPAVGATRTWLEGRIEAWKK